MTARKDAHPLLIYGAYGYSGSLIAQQAVQRGLRPVLAGRDLGRLNQLAKELGGDGGALPIRAYDLTDPAAIDNALQGIQAVLHCAGPFIHTWEAMAEACLRSGAHYLDITGEVAVFEGLAALNDRAVAAGVTLLPGVGFDVVPSDCLAVHLKSRLPSAARLNLALRNLSRASQGTARTALESMQTGGASGGASLIRRGGVLASIPLGSRTRKVDFGRGPTLAVAISWGDLSSAYHSTGIPNIEVYLAVPSALRGMMRAHPLWRPILATRVARRLLERAIEKQPAGPSLEQRQSGRGLLWGEVIDNAGKRAVSRLTTPEPYQLTALAAVAAAEKILQNGAAPGFQTPGKAFGKNFILEIPGCSREDVLV